MKMHQQPSNALMKLKKMVCLEKAEYATDYINPEKCSISNTIQTFFSDASNIAGKYAIGHHRRGKCISENSRKFRVISMPF